MNVNNKTSKLIYFFIVFFLLADLVLLLMIVKTSALKNEALKTCRQLQNQVEELQAENKAASSMADERQAETSPAETEMTEMAAKDDTVETDTTNQKESETEMEALSIIEDLKDNWLNNAESSGQKWAVSIKKLPDGPQEDYHANVPMQSASIIKVFIMGAVYDRVCYPESDDLALYFGEQYEGELKELLTKMITISDNQAANRLVEGLGNGDFDAGAAVVNEFCQQNGYVDTSLGRRFLAENPTGDNYTSAADCCKILSDIYSGVCASSEASVKMLDLLKGQTLKGKIPSGLPNGIESANKTGEMPEGYQLGCIENDIAIVFGEDTDYILCILSNNLDGNNENAREWIRQISSFVYPCLPPHLVQNAAASGI